MLYETAYLLFTPIIEGLDKKLKIKALVHSHFSSFSTREGSQIATTVVVVLVGVVVTLSKNA